MGIFTRLFQRGQDGQDPTEPSDSDTEPVSRLPETDVSTDRPPTPPTTMPAGSGPNNGAAAGKKPPAEIVATPPPATPSRTPIAPAPIPKSARSIPSVRRPSEESAAVAAPAPAKDSGPVIAATTAKERNDGTMVLSPPPAPTPAPAPAPPTPRAAKLEEQRAPVVRFAAPRPKSDSIGSAIESLIGSQDAAPAHGVSTARDLEEVRRTFDEVAAVHVAQVRDVMLELHYGDASAAWIEATQPALRSLRAMAQQLELADLCAALDGFCAAAEATVKAGAVVGEVQRAELGKRYQKLIELIPKAFALDAERDRREPIIVEALLYQVDGVEKPTIDKLFSIGLGKLDALLRANAEDMAAVAGLQLWLAEAIVDKLRSYRGGGATAVSAPDPVAERKQLADLLIILSIQNDEYNHASAQWTEEARAKKRASRRQREEIFLRIKVSLARLGERDQLARLEKLPYGERIAQLDRYLSAQR